MAGKRISQSEYDAANVDVNKLADAQSHIEGVKIAQIVRDFQNEFRDIYPDHVIAGNGVGPLQAMIGLAIKNGILKEGQDYGG